MKYKGRLLIVLVLVGLLAACRNNASPADTAQPTKVLTITATDIAYDTPVIEMKAGQLLRLTLQNDGALEHDFSFMEMPLAGEVTGGGMDMAGHDMSNMEEEPDVHVSAMPGESNTISFTPSRPGVYEYYCTVAGHREAGMSGTLNVAEPSS